MATIRQIEAIVATLKSPLVRAPGKARPVLL